MNHFCAPFIISPSKLQNAHYVATSRTTAVNAKATQRGLIFHNCKNDETLTFIILATTELYRILKLGPVKSNERPNQLG